MAPPRARLLSAACCAALAAAAFRITGVAPNPATLGSAMVVRFADAPSPYACTLYVDDGVVFDTPLAAFRTAGATGSLSFTPDASTLPVGPTHALYLWCNDGCVYDSETPRRGLTTRMPGSAVIDSWPSTLVDGTTSTIVYSTVGLVGNVTLALSISGYTSESSHPAGTSIAVALTPPHELVMLSSTAELVVRGRASNGLLVTSAPRAVQLRSRPPNPVAQLTRENALRGLAYANAAYLPLERLNAWSRADVASVCPECAQLGRAELVRSFNSSLGTEFFVVRKQDGTVIVGFRGTEVLSGSDWIVNGQALPVQYVGCGLCALHTGFLNAYVSVVTELGHFMREAIPFSGRATTPVVVVGHSLGGALATIAAYELKLAGFNVQGLWCWWGGGGGNLMKKV